MPFSVEARLEADDALSRQVAIATMATSRALGGMIEEIDRKRSAADRKEQSRHKRRQKHRRQTRDALRSGARMGAVAATGLAIGAAVAADKFGETELAIAKIGNLIGKDRDAVEEFGGAIKNTAVAFGTDSVDTANAYYQAISAGVPSAKKDILGFMEVAGKASVAGAFSLETAVDGLTNAMNAYGESGTEAATAVADKFAVTEKLGKTTFSELAEGIDKVGPLAAEMGISLDAILGSVVSLSKPGVKTAETFTQLSGVMSGVLKIAASGGARGGLFKRTFGVKAGKNAIKEMGGFGKFVDTLKKKSALPGGENLISKLFGRTEAQKALFRITGKGFDDFDKGTKAIGDSAGQNDRNFANIQKRTGFRLKQMKSGFGVLVAELGGGIADGLGLGEIENVPQAVASAGGIIRSAAGDFAKGFAEAFAPLETGEQFDWPGFAANAGKALGAISSAVGTIASGIASVIAKYTEAWDLALKIKASLEGENEQEKAIKRATGQTGSFKEAENVGVFDSLVQDAFGVSAKKVGSTDADLRAKGVAIKTLSAGDMQRRIRERSLARKASGGTASDVGGSRTTTRLREGDIRTQLEDMAKVFRKARAERKKTEETKIGGKVVIQVESDEGINLRTKNVVSDNAKVPLAVNTGTQKPIT